jgi:hypothetical protein
VRARIVLVIVVALAAASLLAPWALAFDPQMWVVWGRDVTRLTLETRAGPSWKPLPVAFTTPFALFGDAAPALWLVVARAGALAALLGAWELGRRLAGPWAGAAATAAMALSPWWLPNAALGNSEGLLAAAILWAVVAHLAGRRSVAVLLGLAAALLRPEAWPFLGVYGVWAWRADRSTRPAVALAAVAVPLLWIGPDLLGGGSGLGASDAARGEPSEGSAALADAPLLAVIGDALEIAGYAAALAAVAALARLSRRDDPAPARGAVGALAAGALAWVGIVAVMTVAGFAGNPRYLVGAAAALAVLAGVGAVRLARAAGVPSVVGAVVLPVAVAVFSYGGLRDDVREVGVRADRRTALDDVVATAGGRDALLRCGPLRTAPAVRGLVAWRLDVTPLRLDSPAVPPAVVLRMRSYDGASVEPPIDPSAFRRRASAPGWAVWEACRA